MFPSLLFQCHICPQYSQLLVLYHNIIADFVLFHEAIQKIEVRLRVRYDKIELLCHLLHLLRRLICTNKL